MNIGKAINIISAEKEINKVNLAARINMTAGYLTVMMSKKYDVTPSLGALIKIAAVFEMPLSELIARAERL